MRVAIVGTGHIGLVMAVCLADMGYNVTGVDLPDKVELLNQGKVGFFEPGLDEMVALYSQRGRLRFSMQLEDIVDAGVIWITIGTGQTPEGAIEISDIERTVIKLGQLCSHATLIAVKSTLPIGACRHLAEQLPVKGPRLVYNPEFLREGSAIQDFFHPEQIVFGSDSRDALEPLMRIYQSLPCLPVCTDWETAEAIKLAQNALNASLISFINELTIMMEGDGASIERVSQVLRSNSSTLQRYLNPGFSYGGACLPSDVAYLSYFGHTKDYPSPLMQGIARVNELRIDYLVKGISQAIAGLEERHIALWGLAYKANTDDLRNSPSVLLARMLLKGGASILAFDPYLQSDQLEQPGYTSCHTAQETLVEADALVVLTKCPEFAVIPASEIVSAVALDCIFDPVGALPQLKEGK